MNKTITEEVVTKKNIAEKCELRKAQWKNIDSKVTQLLR